MHAVQIIIEGVLHAAGHPHRVHVRRGRHHPLDRQVIQVELARVGHHVGAGPGGGQEARRRARAHPRLAAGEVQRDANEGNGFQTMVDTNM